VNYLESLGYQVEIAENGKDALDLLNTFTPKIIITDLVMPIMDGFELMKNLKKIKLGIPIIVLSSMIQDGLREKCLEMGACKCIQKPFKGEDLKQFIYELLKS
jgi:CheY-like chemotaxis protein